MRTIDVPELGCKAIIVDCDDEQLLLIDAGLKGREREAVLLDALSAT